MDKKINKIIEQYFCNLKDDLCSKINNEYYDDSNKDELIKYIYNYNRLVIDKEDFSKRKRAKNVVPGCDRCIGKRANGEQCTRRKKKDYDFCGTHLKGTPNGKVDNVENEETDYVMKEVSLINKEGIVYIMGGSGDKYEAVDVMKGGVCRLVCSDV